MAHTNLEKSKNAFDHVLARFRRKHLLVALGQTIAFCEAKILCLKANLLRVKALLPKVNLLLAKTLLQKSALLDWSAPGLKVKLSPLQTMKAYGDVNARVNIHTATALGRGRVASPMVGLCPA